VGAGGTVGGGDGVLGEAMRTEVHGVRAWGSWFVQVSASRGAGSLGATVTSYFQASITIFNNVLAAWVH